MAKINYKEEKLPKMQRVLDHARATINLYNNIPLRVKYWFENAYFLDLEMKDRKGNIRNARYIVGTEMEQRTLVDEFCRRYDIEAEEITL